MGAAVLLAFFGDAATGGVGTGFGVRHFGISSPACVRRIGARVWQDDPAITMPMAHGAFG